MEENEKNVVRDSADTPEQETYEPRPAWQVWAARVGLVVFILFLIMYITNIFRGGM